MTDGEDDAYDVAVVGGGPAGGSVAVFTARYGLDTVVFDRGRSSIGRCAHLENYLGFPAGIDIETFLDLAHDHVEQAGASVVPDLVEAVERDDEGFVVTTEDGRTVRADRVVAATRYDGEYLRPVVGDEAFETVELGGEPQERFDRSYPDSDGTTAVPGLYVASPATGPDQQAIIAAGRGGRVARRLIEDVRRARGYPESASDHLDWMRRASSLGPEWDRERWEEWFAGQLPAGVAASALPDLRDRDIDRITETYLEADEVESRRAHAHERLLDHIDDERILERADAIERARSEQE